MGTSLNLSGTKERFSLRNLDWHVYHYNFLRRFTHEEDEFDACRGILKRMKAVSKVDFHWGLVGASFPQALLWKDDCLLGYRKDLRRLGKTTLVTADATSYHVPLPSWSWLGWYTHLGVPNNTEGYVKNPRRGFNTRIATWAAMWLQVDVNGCTTPISGQPLTKCFQSGWPSDGVPLWAGEALQPDFMGLSCNFRDSGRIAARTSHAKLRIRPTVFDIQSRRVGLPPRDRMTYQLLDNSKSHKVIGSLVAYDIVCPVEEFNEMSLRREQTEGRLRDFIVISREVEPVKIPKRKWWESGGQGGIDWDLVWRNLHVGEYSGDTDEFGGEGESMTSEEMEKLLGLESSSSDEENNGKAWLNLMMIQFDESQPGIAFRLGIFTIEEELWNVLNVTSQEWKTIVLQ
jgi:hypothetical protein